MDDDDIANVVNLEDCRSGPKTFKREVERELTRQQREHEQTDDRVAHQLLDSSLVSPNEKQSEKKIKEKNVMVEFLALQSLSAVLQTKIDTSMAKQKQSNDQLIMEGNGFAKEAPQIAEMMTSYVGALPGSLGSCSEGGSRGEDTDPVRCQPQEPRLGCRDGG